MLLAQVTDVHLGFEPDNPSEFNRKRFDQVVNYLCGLNPQPDMLLMSGDLTDLGDSDSYTRLLEAISPCAFPAWPIPGNHDLRENFAVAFPHVPHADGFIQYEVDANGLRILCIDTLEEGRHGGSYCETRAAWLRARLDEKPNTPTIIVMHHPPIDSGIEWMSTHSDEPWVVRFAGAIDGFDNIVGILCGHLHRATSIGWRGKTISICPSTAPQVTLELAPIDPEAPDGRPMIAAEPPGVALHHWNGRELVSYFHTSDEYLTLARYDHRMQDLVRELIAERPS